METKQLGGRIVEVKEEERNGVPVGILAGFIATWDIDRGAFGVKDQFIKGAFNDSIEQHKSSNRPVRLKFQHRTLMGGFPIESIKQDEVGLYGIGEVNLELETGRNVMSLARQGVLSEFSIGFSVDESTEDGGLRRITKATIWEGSVVEEPMNPAAKITQIKNFTVDQVKEWDVREIERFLKETGLSKEASKYLAGRLKVDKGAELNDNIDYSKLLDNIRSIKVK